MKRYSEMVQKVIEESDIVLIVLDARQPRANQDIAKKIEEFGKKHIFVLNKVDLLTREGQARLHIPNSIQVSSQKHMGTMRLYKRIMELAKGKSATVGVVGYPNTGKSTLINSLKGRHSAPTSSVSGYTHGVQKIAVSKKIMLIDTPGVIEEDADATMLEMVGAIDTHKMRDPEGVAINIIEEMQGRVERHFSVERREDHFETLEEIARKKHLILRQGEPDTKRAAREVIALVQKGKIK
ncbi:MAG: GTPase [Candidatus Woesearchaeota archaeon]